MGKTKEIEQYGAIFKTENYNMFKFIGGNRALRTSNIEKMRQSMIEQQLVMPICVNEKFEIIDGQHRFTVCRELKKPVYYYVQEGYSLPEVERANRSNTNWSLNDFLHSFVHKNNDNYVKVDIICDQYNVLASDVIRVISKIENKKPRHVTADFKDENLDFSDEMYEKVVGFFEALTIFKDYPSYTAPKFIYSYLDLYFHQRYNHEHMIEKYIKLGNQMKHCITKDEYLDMLCNKIYSGKKINDHNIYYDLARKQFY